MGRLETFPGRTFDLRPSTFDMCLILFAYRTDAAYPLVVAANRDEFYERPTAPLHIWDDADDLLAGRDLKEGGTWLGITRTGRFAAITNYRDMEQHDPDAPSRGHLVAGFLRGSSSPRHYLETIHPTAETYNGFNLLVGTPAGLFYYSNQEGVIRELEPGVYGLSNALLDTPWPKTERGRRMLEHALHDPPSPEALATTLLDGLYDLTQAPDEALPDTGIGLEWERLLSPMHIRSPEYGTRSASALVVSQQGEAVFMERTYSPEAASPSTRTFDMTLRNAWANEERG